MSFRLPVALLLGAVILAEPAAAQLAVGDVQASVFVDARGEAGSGVSDSVGLMASELDLRISVNRDDAELVMFALGPNLETHMTGRGRRMHFGNYYSVWNFGVARPKLKVGQFVIPFGTLAEYDTHPLVLQTPYARTLGVRIDRGLAVEGARGEVAWQFSLTGGDGRGRVGGSYAANLRAARDYERGDDVYRVGLSLLRGENMPVLPLQAMSVPMHEHDAHDAGHVGRADKTRLALDLDWLRGIDNIRAELVAGTDDGRFVHGAWVSFNRPFDYNNEVTVHADHWRGTEGSVLGLGASYHRKLDGLSGVRLAYEPRWARPHHMPREFAGMVTLQYYRTFLLDW